MYPCRLDRTGRGTQGISINSGIKRDAALHRERQRAVVAATAARPTILLPAVTRGGCNRAVRKSETIFLGEIITAKMVALGM
ncbi:hypothetical protein GWI33_022853 [Rhynchophorus ferrugineus]|uniref:Uncharacterized protein n=1 Tax=Rhynchophorus ferrugineus TaxID=354439 RepID=A0A834MHJ2_RHYFE|nr:hypothetical protein GWI33_022853 [Rhynchophorus ferrugineus]